MMPLQALAVTDGTAGGALLVLAIVITQTNYSPKVQRTKQEMSVTPDGKADEFSRIAGRSAGTLASKIRDKTRQLKET